MEEFAGKALPETGKLTSRISNLLCAPVSVQFLGNTTGIWDEEGQPTAPKKKKKKKKKKKQTTPSAGNEGHGVIDAKATARVFKLEELAIRIATQLHAISPKSVVKLALTCRALEAPALGALWENQGSLSSLIKRVLLTDILYFGFPDPEEDTCLLVSPLSLPSQHPAYLLIMKTR